MKVVLRTLLYSRGKRGRIIENMFIRLQHGETRQNLNIWGYGDKGLARGSGLFIPETGVATYHHSLPPPEREEFVFLRGTYSLEVFVKEVGRLPPYRIFTTSLDLSAEMAAGLAQSAGHGVPFDCRPYRTSRIRPFEHSEVFTTPGSRNSVLTGEAGVRDREAQPPAPQKREQESKPPLLAWLEGEDPF